jgi:hypothetical protein
MSYPYMTFVQNKCSKTRPWANRKNLIRFALFLSVYQNVTKERGDRQHENKSKYIQKLFH